MVRWVLVVVGSLPLVVALLSHVETATSLVSVIDGWFAMHCHRDPSRSFGLFGRLLPVCARCTGIYLGLLVGGLLPSRPLPSRPLLAAAVVGAALLLLDVGTEAMGWRVPGPATRLVLGVVFALPAVLAARGSEERSRYGTDSDRHGAGT